MMSGQEAGKGDGQTLPLNTGIGSALAKRFSERLEQLDSQVGAGRLVLTIVLLGLVVAVFRHLEAFGQSAVILASMMVFLSAGWFQKRIQKKLLHWRALAKSFEAETIRRDRHFSRLLSSGEETVLTPWCLNVVSHATPPSHLYAHDLDVHRLLYPMLDTCLTPAASEKLYRLLLEGSLVSAEDAQARARRIKAVQPHWRLLRELDSCRFIDDTRALGVRTIRAKNSEQTSNRSGDLREKILILAFSALSIVAWAVFLVPAHLEYLAGGKAEIYVGSLFRYALVPLIGLAIFRGVLHQAHELKERFFGLSLLMRHLQHLEKNPELSALAAKVKIVSRDLKRMEWQLGLLHARGNPVFWLFIHVLLPYDTLLSLAVWTQIGRLSSALQPLEEALFEFDVDASFARFANENPEFKASSWVVKATDDDTVLDVADLGHPLLPRGSRVTNSLTWSSKDGLILLTGSNMSGKSTFLRTLGINALLHNLGVPVCASRFRSGPIELLCAIRVDDALEEGTSYFYAEVKRLAQVLDRLRERRSTPPKQAGFALFLVDEIFRGTNNRERYIGSWHVIAALLESGGFGIVTTHDLALTKLGTTEQKSQRKVRNMHFRESVVEDVLHFDYLLREGPCPTTNALRIMRSAGLPVPLESGGETSWSLDSEG